LLLIALLVSLLPGMALAQFAPSVEASTPTVLPTAPPPSLDPAGTALPAPIPDPELPSLALSVAVAPDPVVVGQTATLTLTIDNAAKYPAEDLVVTLPLPEGVALGANSARTATGWEWKLGRLAGQSQATLTTTLRLEALPAGQALILRPEANARGLSLPATTVGGAVVLPASAAQPSTSRYNPGAAARLRSPDQRIQVEFPARGFERPLTLRASSALSPSCCLRSRYPALGAAWAPLRWRPATTRPAMSTGSAHR
jgi:uncharacterized repeat protein (TIGR01451 family)